jgi:hypothetical protein
MMEPSTYLEERMTDSKELAMAKILLWRVFYDGEGNKEDLWRAQLPGDKRHWLDMAKDVLYHYESTRVSGI